MRIHRGPTRLKHYKLIDHLVGMNYLKFKGTLSQKEHKTGFNVFITTEPAQFGQVIF